MVCITGPCRRGGTPPPPFDQTIGFWPDYWIGNLILPHFYSWTIFVAWNLWILDHFPLKFPLRGLFDMNSTLTKYKNPKSPPPFLKPFARACLAISRTTLCKGFNRSCCNIVVVITVEEVIVVQGVPKKGSQCFILNGWKNYLGSY